MAYSSPTDPKASQELAETQLVPDGLCAMGQSTNQIPNHDTGDTTDEESGFKIYESHSRIIRNWLTGNTYIPKQYWDMRLHKYEGEKTLIHRAISEMNTKMKKKKSHSIWKKRWN